MTESYDVQRLTRNFARIACQSQAIMQELAAHQPEKPEGPSVVLAAQLGNAYLDFLKHLLADPAKFAKMQLEWWQDYAALVDHSAKRLMGEETAPVIKPESRDKRWRDPAWHESALYDFIKQSYLLAGRRALASVRDAELNPHQARKLDFYTRQYLDAVAPSNFLLTNPEVLRTTLETGGDNLVKGLSKLLEDLERSKGKLRISMTDPDAFELGRNLATTPGKVIYENALMQLIQYEPATAKVHKTPLLLIPAWINKYYIFDLQPENSFVAWAVAQGYTVFVISWVNPDEKLAQKTFDDYLLEGPLAALDAIEQATGEKTVAAVGYCLGGTLLAITQAYLAAQKQSKRIVSTTFLTTMIDFREAGELAVFIDEEQLSALEDHMAEKGYLEGEEMANTFNLLRANDLIWSFAVNNYLLGKDPFPFDLLYWNADSTRMPSRMHSFYLRNMYQKNLLVKPGGITLAGVPVDLGKVKTPSYILSTCEDHIAPWKSAYAATQIYKGDITFVLAASGHVAGVINPPAKNKYGFWTNARHAKHAVDWLESAYETPGSWWPHWDAWQKKFSGPKVSARKIKKFIEPAPGRYAKVRN